VKCSFLQNPKPYAKWILSLSFSNAQLNYSFSFVQIFCLIPGQRDSWVILEHIAENLAFDGEQKLAHGRLTPWLHIFNPSFLGRRTRAWFEPLRSWEDRGGLPSWAEGGHGVCFKTALSLAWQENSGPYHPLKKLCFQWKFCSFYGCLPHDTWPF
jgi:hypothetical protein